MRYLAHFVPQAWMDDYAVRVDAEGPVEWDATKKFETLDPAYRQAMLAEMDSDGEALDRFDALKSDRNAPRWIRGWRGPFSVYVRRTEGSPPEAPRRKAKDLKDRKRAVERAFRKGLGR